MLERVIVQNFQSLKKVDLELGRFTVIVGPSSSGKSAFMRALRGLASNIRGSSVITTGEKTTSITAYTEKDVITLQRGATSGKYLLTDRFTGEQQTFTKLAQKVPEKITQALGIQPVTTSESSINFAGQFDKPYLLGEPASQVARVLGDLTNVSTLFEAVREANKKKLAVNSLLKTRKSDLEGLIEQAEAYRGLKSRAAIVEAAERALEEALELQAEADKLEEVISSLEASEAIIASFTELPEAPSLDELESAYQDLLSYKQTVVAWATAKKSMDLAEQQVRDAILAEEKIEEELHAHLAELGTCPTCGQEISV